MGFKIRNTYSGDRENFAATILAISNLRYGGIRYTGTLWKHYKQLNLLMRYLQIVLYVAAKSLNCSGTHRSVYSSNFSLHVRELLCAQLGIVSDFFPPPMFFIWNNLARGSTCWCLSLSRLCTSSNDGKGREFTIAGQICACVATGLGGGGGGGQDHNWKLE